MIESSLIEPLYALRYQQISVGDQAANHSVVTDAANDVIQLRMQQWLATTDDDERSAQLCQLVNAAVHLLHRNGIGEIVIFAAIGAGKSASAHRNELCLDRM